MTHIAATAILLHKTRTWVYLGDLDIAEGMCTTWAISEVVVVVILYHEAIISQTRPSLSQNNTIRDDERGRPREMESNLAPFRSAMNLVPIPKQVFP